MSRRSRFKGPPEVSNGDSYSRFVTDWAETYAQINKRDVHGLLRDIADKNPCFAKRAQIPLLMVKDDEQSKN